MREVEGKFGSGWGEVVREVKVWRVDRGVGV